MENLTLTTNELGTLLFETSNAKSKFDAPTKSKLSVRQIVLRVYLLLLAAGLLAWFLISLIIGAQAEGFGTALLNHLAALFGVIAGELIIIFTAFSLWGKFARRFARMKGVRGTGRHRYRREGAELRALQAELDEADENKPTENALRIYPEYIVVINDGIKTTLSRAEIETINCYDFGKELIFAFYADGETLAAKARVRKAELPLMRKIFGEKLDYARLTAPVKQGGKPQAGTMPYDDIPEQVKEASEGVIRRSTVREKLPVLFFMMVPLFVGAAVLTVHFVVLPDMPLIFGVLFIGFGVLGMSTVFGEIPVFAYGVTPVLGGLFITAIPISVLFMLEHYLEMSALSLLMPFTIVHAVLSVFAGFGLMLVIMGIAGIVRCIRYREK